MHRIRMGIVFLDFAPDVHDAGRAFWATVLAGTVRESHEHDGYSGIEGAASAAHVLVQRLGEGTSRVHLDLETDDIDAEVRRLESIGAVRVRRFDRWQVMRDPAGVVFCVVPPLSDDFAAGAREVED
jgi:hypothetical protein